MKSIMQVFNLVLLVCGPKCCSGGLRIGLAGSEKKITVVIIDF